MEIEERVVCGLDIYCHKQGLHTDVKINLGCDKIRGIF
jgi:hypothetical protein